MKAIKMVETVLLHGDRAMEKGEVFIVEEFSNNSTGIYFGASGKTYRKVTAGYAKVLLERGEAEPVTKQYLSRYKSMVTR